MSPRLLPYGERAWLVELADGDERRAWHAALTEGQSSTVARVRGIVEVIPAARTVLVLFRSEVDARTGVASLRSLTVSGLARDDDPAPTIDIPVRYDGADLAEVSRLLGLEAAEVVALHRRQRWFVDFMGFLPGFAYLLPEGPARPLRVPRRDSPRTHVPPGSLGLADQFSGLYPQASPGGWQLIGHTTARLWDQHRDPPALLWPGVAIRFVDADDQDVEPAEPGEPAVETTSPNRTAFTVLDPGAQLLLEDLGRPGHAHLAVSGGGAADRGALSQGNRLLGNPEGAAGLENLLGGALLRSELDQWVCVTGAPGPVTAGHRAVAHGEPVWLRAEQRVRIGPATSGLRRYLCRRGGLGGAPLLGSRSTDPVSGLGPPALRAGDTIAADEAPPAPSFPVGLSVHEPATSRPFRLHPGPRTDWFAGGLSALTAAVWTVTSDLNRIGLRLDGPPLRRIRAGELPSEAILRGAVQIPPSGQPMIFGPDHPTTGGYPVIACLADAEQDRFAQLRPGDRVSFWTRRGA